MLFEKTRNILPMYLSKFEINKVFQLLPRPTPDSPTANLAHWNKAFSLEWSPSNEIDGINVPHKSYLVHNIRSPNDQFVKKMWSFRLFYFLTFLFINFNNILVKLGIHDFWWGSSTRINDNRRAHMQPPSIVNGSALIIISGGIRSI